jgi:AcrR family transcriptional regulator
MVAAEARLSHGLIRFHFGSRDALIEATMEYAAHRSLSGATATAAAAGDADDDLAEIGAHLRDVAEDAEDTLAFHLEMMAEARRRPELLPLARRVVEGFENAVRAQLQAHGYDDPDLVILVAAAMDGLVQRQTVTGDGQATDRAMRSFRAMLKLVPH